MVIIGFILNNFVDKGFVMIVLLGVVCLLFFVKKNFKEMFEGVEWEILFFFIGLFMMIKGIENFDIIKFIGDKMIYLIEGYFGGVVFLIMWILVVFILVIGNVVNVVIFLKIINIMILSFLGVVGIKVFWWVLFFGFCLGGNLSLFGFVINVVVVGVVDKVGCKIKFV